MGNFPHCVVVPSWIRHEAKLSLLFPSFEMQLSVDKAFAELEGRKNRRSFVFSCFRKTSFFVYFFSTKYLRTSLAWSSDWTTFDFLVVFQPIDVRRENLFLSTHWRSATRRWDDTASGADSLQSALSLFKVFSSFLGIGFFSLSWRTEIPLLRDAVVGK